MITRDSIGTMVGGTRLNVGTMIDSNGTTIDGTRLGTNMTTTSNTNYTMV